MKHTQYEIYLTEEDIIDVTLYLDGKIIRLFSVNYRAKINNEWKQIYRADNAHGFVHEHRFWRTGKPIAIKDYEPLNESLTSFLASLKENYSRYKTLYKLHGADKK